MVCLEALFNNKDTLAVLPMGYGKSLLYKVLPVLAERNTRLALIQGGKKNKTSGSCSSIVLVVCPVNSLIDDQLRKINERSDLSATALKVNVDKEVYVFHETLKTLHLISCFFIRRLVCHRIVALNYCEVSLIRRQFKQLSLMKHIVY